MEIYSSSFESESRKVQYLVPTGLTFKWRANSGIPSKAYSTSDRPFTGDSTVGQSVYDGSGPFLNGEPNGTFCIVVGDRSSGDISLLNGVKQNTSA